MYLRVWLGKGDSLKQDSGIALVLVLFLIIVVGSAAVSMHTLLGLQNASSVSSIQAARAEAAVHAGFEWMNYHLYSDFGCDGSPFEYLMQESDLSGFNLHIVCQPEIYLEDATEITIYNVTVTATKGNLGEAEFVRRQRTMMFEF